MERNVTTTYNTDVHSMVRRYNRMIIEANKSQSSGLTFTMSFDAARMRSYVAAMQSYIAFVVGQPLLDCPETGPTETPLPPRPEVLASENDSSYDILQLIEIARDELANSQSARMPTGLIAFDHDRQMSYLSKIIALLDYVEAAEPLDMPESSPMHAITGPGNLGV